jgi:hypothetical protein
MHGEIRRHTQAGLDEEVKLTLSALCIHELGKFLPQSAKNAHTMGTGINETVKECGPIQVIVLAGSMHAVHRGVHSQQNPCRDYILLKPGVRY